MDVHTNPPDRKLTLLYSWAVILIAAALLGLLRHIASSLIDGHRDPAVATTFALVLFLVLVLLYVGGRIWRLHIHFGDFLAESRRVFILAFCTFILFMLPRSLAENTTWFDWFIDIGFATAFSAILAGFSEGLIRREVDGFG